MFFNFYNLSAYIWGNAQVKIKLFLLFLILITPSVKLLAIAVTPLWSIEYHANVSSPALPKVILSEEGYLGAASGPAIILDPNGHLVSEEYGGYAMNDVSYCCNKFGFVNGDGYVYIYDLSTRTWKKVYVGVDYNQAITMLKDGFLAGGVNLAYFDFNGNKRWDVSMNYIVNGPAVYKGYVYVPREGGGLTILKLSDGSEVKTIKFSESVWDAQVCGHYLALGTAHHVYLYDISDPTNPRELWNHDGIGGAYSVAFSPDCRYLVSADADDWKIHIFDVQSGKQVLERMFESYVGSVDWKGDKIAVGLWVPGPRSRFHVLDVLDCDNEMYKPILIVKMSRGGFIPMWGWNVTLQDRLYEYNALICEPYGLKLTLVGLTVTGAYLTTISLLTSLPTVTRTIDLGSPDDITVASQCVCIDGKTYTTVENIIGKSIISFSPKIVCLSLYVTSYAGYVTTTTSTITTNITLTFNNVINTTWIRRTITTTILTLGGSIVTTYVSSTLSYYTTYLTKTTLLLLPTVLTTFIITATLGITSFASPFFPEGYPINFQATTSQVVTLMNNFASLPLTLTLFVNWDGYCTTAISELVANTTRLLQSKSSTTVPLPLLLPLAYLLIHRRRRA
ncbi:hypothetical protein IPA_08795 [Ignicoccus pacificus DSM 13166]|uniref:WD40 repeat domain-containing protein n=1 Tax=Ignicoccus pacificus DSM 13166 TaxID=940294 RepID=A0A977KC13_9CREN|nr:hypothetical protein IPA_08795 [Ignicoccus pacificus DSM 13166]